MKNVEAASSRYCNAMASIKRARVLGCDDLSIEHICFGAGDLRKTRLEEI